MISLIFLGFFLYIPDFFGGNVSQFCGVLRNSRKCPLPLSPKSRWKGKHTVPCCHKGLHRHLPPGRFQLRRLVRAPILFSPHDPHHRSPQHNDGTGEGAVFSSKNVVKLSCNFYDGPRAKDVPRPGAETWPWPLPRPLGSCPGVQKGLKNGPDLCLLFSDDWFFLQPL